MPDRLSAIDVSFLYMEGPTTAMHVGGVAILRPPDGGMDYDDILELIERRISLIPRYRQKVLSVPGHLGNPVWVDDKDFDVSYHVRRSALPRPGTRGQLRDLVARLMSRQLDRNRPLWEMYVVEGLADGEVAIVTKTHHAMADGASAMDIGALILDVTPTPRETPVEPWTPARPPYRAELVGQALGELLLRPVAAAETVRAGLTDARAVAGKVLEGVGGVLAAARTTVRSAPSSPLNATIGAQRRFATADTALDDYKLVRKAFGGTVNDVVLATVAGALRGWLQTRGEPVGPATSVRAMVPVSVRGPGPADGGNKISSYFVDLPVGEPDPVVRLHQVAHSMLGHKDSRQSMGADTIVAMAGFAPPTLHSLAARAASSVSRRLFNLVVTNVPGPQFPLFAAGAQMTAVYPVVPLAKGQAVCLALTSYNGGVFWGLNADRDAMPDVDVLAEALTEALAELVATVR